jgi:hypothetical protein
MSILDVTGGAMLSRMYRRGGITPLALGLLGFLGYRAYQNRARMADMLGGALGGIGKIPAMVLPMVRLQREKKAPTRRRTSTKSRGTSAKTRKANGTTRTRAKRSDSGTQPTVH